MKKRKFINFKYIAVIMILFSFTGTVYGFGIDLSPDGPQYDLYEKCNSELSCVQLCVYSALDKDKRQLVLNDEFLKRGDHEIGYVGYYKNNKKWEIGTYSDKKLYTFLDTRLPKSNIYWENYGSNKNETWNNGPKITDEKNGYEKLSDSFECPAYMSIDIEDSIDLCFANSAGKCDEQNNSKISFVSDHPIKYSFGDTLKKVIDDAYNELRIDDSSSEDAKAKFLHDADPDNITYDSTKSGKENVESNCEFVKSKMEDQDSYINTIVSKSSNFSQAIDDKLTESAKKIDTRNRYVFNMKDLGSILTKSDGTKRDIKDSEGTLYADKLGNIYEKSVLSSMRYYGEVCGFEFDEAKFLDKVKEEYETKIYELPNIDIDSKFDCSTISGIADLISTGYFIIEILALILLVGLTVLDYAKVILSGEQDEMKKSNKRLLTRIIIAALILLLPMLINLILGVFHIEGFDSDNPLCVEIKNK